ncbi:hypothetical protein CEXT_696571 [Caerostris extrusa]|uniref:Secreted protein n=1 Tax=Caerostris extrusa TaxID=172846 RepID=A0AAV4PVC9_CAEEX|nr:hypothetical protein CEXT_696571 [Caerostris extrusa]
MFPYISLSHVCVCVSSIQISGSTKEKKRKCEKKMNKKGEKYLPKHSGSSLYFPQKRKKGGKEKEKLKEKEKKKRKKKKTSKLSNKNDPSIFAHLFFCGDGHFCVSIQSRGSGNGA